MTRLHRTHRATLGALAVGAAALASCDGAPAPEMPTASEAEVPATASADVIRGVDLSYVNQIVDRGGRFGDSLGVRDPYAIFAHHGAAVVRLRLWNDPRWVRSEVYGTDSVPLYSGIDDVARAMRSVRAAGMEVLLDLHYSDTWADPERQDVPAGWRAITRLGELEDSVYTWTRATLARLADDSLLPAYVQVGNEINRGMMSTGAPQGFPALSVHEGHWEAQGRVLRAGIRAVREAAPGTRVILHIAQPENVAPFFDEITTRGGVDDFDIVGLSYYSRWSEVALGDLGSHIARFRERYQRDVMVVETAYPWTTANADGYGNIFGPDDLEPGYPATPEGQAAYLGEVVRQVAAGGGIGVFTWEPAWITSPMKDLWGIGSSWENNAHFDVEGRVHAGMRWLTAPHDREGSDP